MATFQTWQVSNIFLTARTMLKMLGQGAGATYTVVGLVWLFVFFVSRMVPAPLLVGCLAQACTPSLLI